MVHLDKYRWRRRSPAASYPWTLQGIAIGALLTLSAIAADAAATPRPDFAREQRMADQIVDAILDGEAIELVPPGAEPFLAIYTESAEESVLGTVILLHGRGFHPDWAEVIHPLRVGLSAFGWNTLSIQLPVLEKEARYYDYIPVFDDAIPRIEAAIARAVDLDPDGRIVMAAHSCGYHMAQHWIHVRGAAATEGLDAFIGIGMGATDAGQRMREPFPFGRMAMPVLDVYGERDFPAVRRLSAERWQALQAVGNPRSAQIVVPDADHYFVDRGDALLDTVAGWLQQL